MAFDVWVVVKSTSSTELKFACIAWQGEQEMALNAARYTWENVMRKWHKWAGLGKHRHYLLSSFSRLMLLPSFTWAVVTKTKQANWGPGGWKHGLLDTSRKQFVCIEKGNGWKESEDGWREKQNMILDNVNDSISPQLRSRRQALMIWCEMKLWNTSYFGKVLLNPFLNISLKFIVIQ